MKTKPAFLVRVSSRACRHLICCAALMTIAVKAQALDPAYLSEMPSVERVKAEIQGADPMDMAARQAGACFQLRQIVYDLALNQRRDRSEVTPDEKRLADGYYAAAYYAAQPIDKSISEQDKPKWFKLQNRYNMNPTFREELFSKFFSAAFRTAYFKAIGEMDGRVQKRLDDEQKAFKEAQAQEKLRAKQEAADFQYEREVARCFAAGRPVIECVTEVWGKAFSEVVAIANPALKEKTPPPGLRLNGDYSGQAGFGLAFHSNSASVKCGDLVPEPRDYVLQTKGNQVVVTVQSDPTPIVLALTSDGKLAGSGPTEVKGRIIVGYSTQQTTQNKQIQEYERYQYNPGSVSRDAFGNLQAAVPATVSVPIYKPKTERCNIVVLSPSAARAPSPEGVPGFLGALFPDPSAKKLPQPPAGLRLNGQYENPGGLGIEFRSGFATVGCAEVAVVNPYAVEQRDTGVVVTVQNQPKPLVFALGPDGTLNGSGPAQISGRTIGVTQDSNDPIVYQARTVTCNTAILKPSPERIGPAEAGAAAARAAYNQPSVAVKPNAALAPAKPNSAAAPTTARSTAGNAVLSVASGFANGPGNVNPIARLSLLLLRTSLETVLTNGGVRPPPGMSVIQAWIGACSSGQPSCHQALDGIEA